MEPISEVENFIGRLRDRKAKLNDMQEHLIRSVWRTTGFSDQGLNLRCDVPEPTIVDQPNPK